MVCLPDTSTVFTVVGLSLDIAGIIWLFFVAPEKHYNPMEWFGNALPPSPLRDTVEEHTKDQKRRGWYAGFAVWLLIIGFALQIVGQLIPVYWS